MSLLEDLDDLAQLHELAPQIRARLRAAAARLRAEFGKAKIREEGGIYWRGWHDAIRELNGGPSPPITPGSPGGGDVMLPGQRCVRHQKHGGAHEAYENSHWAGREEDIDTCNGGGRCPYVVPSALPVEGKAGKVPDSESLPATPPTTPTCASWCGTPVVSLPDGAPFWFGAWNVNQRKTFAYCSLLCRDAGRPLHPRTPCPPTDS